MGDAKPPAVKKTAINQTISHPESTTHVHPTEPVGVVILGGDFQALGVTRSLARRNVPVYLLDKGLCIGRFSRYIWKFGKCPDAKEETLLFRFLISLARKESEK